MPCAAVDIGMGKKASITGGRCQERDEGVGKEFEVSDSGGRFREWEKDADGFGG